MKKFFSLVLALVMALSLTTVAWAADVTVTNSTELQAAVNDSANAGKTIKLTASATSYKVELTSASADNLTIEGVDGAVMSYLEAAVGYEGTFTVKNCTFDVPATTWCYACLQGKYNVTFDTCTFKAGNMDSAIYVENGYDDAVFTLKNCTFYGTYVETPVVLSNSASHAFAVTATGNTFVGNDGGLGVYAKDSTMTLTTNEENITHLAQSEAAIHAAVAVADAGDTIKLRKNSSNSPMTLATLPVLSKPITIDANDVTLANFPEGENITTNADGEITGGTFGSDVPDTFVADGYRLVNGTVAAVPANTTGVVGGYEGMFTTVGATRQAITNLTKTLAVAPLDVDEDGYYNRPGDRIGSIEYYTLNFGGAVAQNYYRVDSVGDADLIVYVGDSKTPYMYLANEPAGGFTYVYGATVFNNFGKACGQFKYAAVDTTKTYYAYDGKVYVANPVGDVNLMVGGNFIQATDVTIAGTWVAHVPVYTQDKTGVVTAVKCANCPASAVIVANYACLPDAVKADDAYFNVPGSATKLFYWVDGVVVDTETKVESAETFDAGIAMYVGMSVMAAAGSAVVLKKRED